MGFLSRFLPKPKQVPIKNNMPKEKKHIKTSFLMYCHKNHDTSGDKLCPKCTALLAVVMVKMNKCPYGVQFAIPAIGHVLGRLKPRNF